jgi:alpha-1,6-mannosyltransferase
MRIVDVCGFYTPHGGGVRTYVERKLRTGPAAGKEIVVIAPGETDSVTEYGDGAWLVTIASPQFPFDRRYRYFDDEAALHRVLDQWRPDLVEVSSPWKSADMVARWRGSAPRALVMHCDPLSAYAYRWFGLVASYERIDGWFSWFWRRLHRLDAAYDFVISASTDLSTRLLHGGMRKVRTVPMGVEPGIFSPELRDEALRTELLLRCGLGPEATLAIGVGRHAPEKRWPMVMEAANMAGVTAPLGMVLIGDGRGRARVARAAANKPHVALYSATSNRDQLARIMASSDVLVHGCEAETFCMVAAEAQASGLPLIVPDRGGASDQFRPGQGFRYQAQSATDLYEKMGVFLADDPVAHRSRAAASAAQVRTMDMHFMALFATYLGTAMLGG